MCVHAEGAWILLTEHASLFGRCDNEYNPGRLCKGTGIFVVFHGMNRSNIDKKKKTGMGQ